ncbi:MAG: septum formation inhibitor Maf [Firmicutes bacterium]|nr:septum formation inhibitor Maf [Bacillota bacterium]
MTKIILASASPRRAELLRQIGLDFEVQVSGVSEEGVVDKDPAKLVEKLAIAKALAVAKNQPRREAVVIAADTVVCVDGTLLGKPKDSREAGEMLRLLSGRSHQVLTGIAVVALPVMKVLSQVEKTEVFMRRLSAAEIDWYLTSGEPYDKAGGYGIQGKAAVFVEKIEGCYFNVVGLPLAALWRLLNKLKKEHMGKGAGEYDTAPDHQGSATH